MDGNAKQCGRSTGEGSKAGEKASKPKPDTGTGSNGENTAKKNALKKKPDREHIKIGVTLLALPTNQREMLQKMMCEGNEKKCGRIPSPLHRYLCPRGHQFCHDCAMELITKKDGECSFYNYDFTRIHLHPDPVVRARLEAETHWGPECSLKIRQYPNDPVYNSLYLNMEFRCPSGCKARFKGSEVVEHLCSCKVFKLQRESKAGDGKKQG